MKAAQINGYANEVKLVWNDIATPVLKDNDILVKVKAAGVNPLDLLIAKGNVKMIIDYPFPLTMGNELAGIVEAVGKSVKAFRTGDSVYARLPETHIGAFAQYAAIDENALAKMPQGLDFVEAAAIPLTALTAYQVLREKLDVKPGESIFISGGTGGLGAMAVPLANHFGLHVITNGGEEGRQRMLALGADEFLDYTREDYTKQLSNIDYVLDTTREIEKELSILKPGGKVVSLAAIPNYRFAAERRLPLIKKLLFGLAGAKLDSAARKQRKEYHFWFMHADGKQLAEITRFVEAVNLKPSIDSVFEWAEVNAALAKVSTGHAKGKVVLRFE